MTTTWVYEVVRWPVTKTFRCEVCNRPGKRSKTFRETINPFNKHKYGPKIGQVKIRSEIMAELKVQAGAWKPIMHARCEAR